ncbi:phenol hydroxylase subunit [Solimonas flava]|jgi:phenol hydroxylase P0 protein|uniref:Phenol hydroxylase subunit n=1 Tax=uncultured bacterium UPO41 TaxID=1776966 RepID=A0A126SZM3_9BACT|nr:phenol hydroxylase subunit [Solimonas flava]AMK59122.1 phenol hydroxylase subunit [uncultured bacterium UPO41]
MQAHNARSLLDGVDTKIRFVRRNRVNDHGYVEFSFGIGSPDLMVELVLSERAYAEFCKTNQCIELTPAQSLAVDLEQAKWRYGKAGITE